MMNPRKNCQSQPPMRGLWWVKFYDILSQNYFKYDWVWSYDDSILTCSILSSIFNRLGSSDFGANRRKSRKWAITSAMDGHRDREFPHHITWELNSKSLFQSDFRSWWLGHSFPWRLNIKIENELSIIMVT